MMNMILMIGNMFLIIIIILLLLIIVTLNIMFYNNTLLLPNEAMHQRDTIILCSVFS